uniref:Uncharacterized protein n=1 Tax=Onchocerca volvulus TaxID=6282 RepID=A0A8R1XMH7_ONCVO
MKNDYSDHIMKKIQVSLLEPHWPGCVISKQHVRH